MVIILNKELDSVNVKSVALCYGLDSINVKPVASYCVLVLI